MSVSNNPGGESGPAREASGTLVSYTIKVLIAVMLFFGGLVVVLPDLQVITSRLQKEFRKEQSRVRLTGLFTTNPAVHMKISHIREQAGDIPGAIMEIELAVGLLELHSADKAVLARYLARLEELRRKLPEGRPAAAGK